MQRPTLTTGPHLCSRSDRLARTSPAPGRPTSTGFGKSDCDRNDLATAEPRHDANGGSVDKVRVGDGSHSSAGVQGGHPGKAPGRAGLLEKSASRRRTKTVHAHSARPAIVVRADRTLRAVRADGGNTEWPLATPLVGERIRSLRYQGPEQRSREGADATDRVQHGAGIHSVSIGTIHLLAESRSGRRSAGCGLVRFQRDAAVSEGVAVA
jgi:hypothetical protein